jgi:hypothetical protein
VRGSLDESRKRYLRIKPRRTKIESWPRIKPCVNVGLNVKTYAILLSRENIGEERRSKMQVANDTV